jgi:hypothetical protein
VLLGCQLDCSAIANGYTEAKRSYYNILGDGTGLTDEDEEILDYLAAEVLHNRFQWEENGCQGVPPLDLE